MPRGRLTPCSPFSNPDAGIAIGSGYNSAYPITCRADIGKVFLFGPPFSCLALDQDGNCTHRGRGLQTAAARESRRRGRRALWAPGSGA